MLLVSQTFLTAFNVALGAVFAAGLLGNLLVLAVILSQKSAHTVINVYLANLAIADLLHLLSAPLLIHLTLVGSWVWGHSACVIYYLLYYINWTVSIFVIVAMSFDRYRAVVAPFGSQRWRTKTFAAGLLACLWLLSGLLMSPVGLCAHLHLGLTPELNRSVAFCVHSGPPSQTEDQTDVAPLHRLREFFLNPANFSRYLFVIGCVLPGILLAIFYGLILHKLHSLRRARAASASAGTGGGAAARFERVTVLVSAVVAFYLACSLPHWVHVNVILAADAPAEWMGVTSHLTTLLSYLGSAGNPALYAFLNDSFRAAMAGCGGSWVRRQLETSRRHLLDTGHHGGGPTETAAAGAVAALQPLGVRTSAAAIATVAKAEGPQAGGCGVSAAPAEEILMETAID